MVVQADPDARALGWRCTFSSAPSALHSGYEADGSAPSGSGDAPRRSLHCVAGVEGLCPRAAAARWTSSHYVLPDFGPGRTPRGPSDRPCLQDLELADLIVRKPVRALPRAARAGAQRRGRAREPAPAACQDSNESWIIRLGQGSGRRCCREYLRPRCVPPGPTAAISATASVSSSTVRPARWGFPPSRRARRRAPIASADEAVPSGVADVVQ